MSTRVQRATVRGADIEVELNDGQPGRTVPLLWLRDHCPSPQTHHPETRQRLIDTFRIPMELTARAVEVESEGCVLRIDWAQEDHVSRFPAKFFADLRPDPEVLPLHRRTWDADSIARQLPQVPYTQVMCDDKMLRDFLEYAACYGLCFVEGVPASPEATRALALRVAYIRETIFGGYWDVTANLEHKDTAYTSAAIAPHTDGTYSLDAPGYQMFHCLAAQCTGGENVLIDGFRIAELMRLNYPEEYRLLTEVAIPGQYVDEGRGIHLIARRPPFRLNQERELVQVSYNNHDRAAFLLTADRLRALYHALNAFADLCADPSLRYVRRLLPGSAVLFDNWRVLHARAAYTGFRRLAGVYLNKEDVESRLRVLRERFPS